MTPFLKQIHTFLSIAEKEYFIKIENFREKIEP